jgi:hypothetical protein
MSLPSQGTPYQIPQAIRLTPDNAPMSKDSMLSNSSTASTYVINQGEDAEPVIGAVGRSIAFNAIPISALAAVDYPSPVPVGYVTPPPPILGFQYQQWTCPTDPISVVSSAAPVSVWPLFTNLPANMSGLFALEIYCNTAIQYTFTTVGYLATNATGAVSSSFGFGGNSYFPTQGTTGGPVSALAGAQILSLAAPSIGLYQFTLAATAQTFNLTLRSLMNQ